MPTENKAKTESAPNLLLVVGLILLALAFLFIGNLPHNPTISIDGNKLDVEVADDREERKIGLSNRESLDDKAAMLFVFDLPSKYGFWMADMNFSIDIMWLNRERTVVHVETEVSPDSYPTVYYPNVNASYVVETNAGWVKDKGIQLGDQVEFDL